MAYADFDATYTNGIWVRCLTGRRICFLATDLSEVEVASLLSPCDG